MPDKLTLLEERNKLAAFAHLVLTTGLPFDCPNSALHRIAIEHGLLDSELRAMPLLSERTEEPPPSPWQPIETAPKDGKTVWCWWFSEVRKFAYLNFLQHGREEGWYVRTEDERPASWVYASPQPNHWMPLPDPPEGGRQ